MDASAFCSCSFMMQFHLRLIQTATQIGAACVKDWKAQEKCHAHSTLRYQHAHFLSPVHADRQWLRHKSSGTAAASCAAHTMGWDVTLPQVLLGLAAWVLFCLLAAYYAVAQLGAVQAVLAMVLRRTLRRIEVANSRGSEARDGLSDGSVGYRCNVRRTASGKAVAVLRVGGNACRLHASAAGCSSCIL